MVTPSKPSQFYREKRIHCKMLMFVTVYNIYLIFRAYSDLSSEPRKTQRQNRPRLSRTLSKNSWGVCVHERAYYHLELRSDLITIGQVITMQRCDWLLYLSESSVLLWFCFKLVTIVQVTENISSMILYPCSFLYIDM